MKKLFLIMAFILITSHLVQGNNSPFRHVIRIIISLLETLKEWFFAVFTVLLILGTPPIYAQETILCDEANCQYAPNINVRYQGGGTDFSSFEISPNTTELEITKVIGEKNREVRGTIYNVSPIGRALNVSLEVDNFESEGSNLVIVGDIFSSLGIDIDGFPGTGGKDSDFICGENFINGAYGPYAKMIFDARRLADEELSARCDSVDIAWLDQNRFTCPQGFVEHPGTEVDVKRIEKKRKCTAQGIRAKCVRRTYAISCDSTQRTGSSWCCSVPKDDWWTDNIDDLYMPTPEGWSCDPLKCETKIVGGEFVNKNGINATLNWNVPEVVYDQGKEKACFYHYENNEPDVSWQTLVYEIPGDTASPLIRGPDKYDEVGILYSGRVNNNHFEIPAPENQIIPLQGNDWVYAKRRYAIDTQKSTTKLRNCLGLNGSEQFDTRCERVSGPPADIYIYPVDSKNNVGKEVKISVPEGQFDYESHYCLTFYGFSTSNCPSFSPDNHRLFAVPVNHPQYAYIQSIFNGQPRWNWTGGLASGSGDFINESIRQAVADIGLRVSTSTGSPNAVVNAGLLHCNSYSANQIYEGQPCYFNLSEPNPLFYASRKLYFSNCSTTVGVQQQFGPTFWDPTFAAGHFNRFSCSKRYVQ